MIIRKKNILRDIRIIEILNSKKREFTCLIASMHINHKILIHYNDLSNEGFNKYLHLKKSICIRTSVIFLISTIQRLALLVKNNFEYLAFPTDPIWESDNTAMFYDIE